MKETLISFETAKIAKEKGFDIPVLYGVYGRKMKLTHDVNHKLINWNASTKQQKQSQATSVPTQSLLQKWLREDHSKELFVYKNLEKGKYICYLYSGVKRYSGYTENEGDTYEQALEKGLTEALKLI